MLSLALDQWIINIFRGEKQKVVKHVMNCLIPSR